MRPRAVPLVVVVALALVPAGAGCSTGAPTEARVLTSSEPVLTEALADLALERAELGTRWLTRVRLSDGSLYYRYFPDEDKYDDRYYNEVRHAGTTYCLWQAFDATDDFRVREAAEAATRYIDEHSPAAPDGSGRHFEFNGDTKLGGQALAVVALLERRRVTGQTDRDELIGELARFLLSLEKPDRAGEKTGEYFHFYEDGVRHADPPSDYYPGEALLALTRLALQFPGEGGYLEAAKRAGEYMAHRQNGDVVKAGRAPYDDHWLAIAAAELYRLAPHEHYATVAYLQAERMIANQFGADGAEQPAALIGAPKDRFPVNYTSTATKGEALVAAWGLAQFRDDPGRALRYSTAARRNVQFQMRVQYTPVTAEKFEKPGRVVGGWAQDAEFPYIRIDFVQHNVSALLGVWWLTKTGDVPQAKPAPS